METYLASEKIWVTKYIYADAEEEYQIYLAKNSNKNHAKIESTQNNDVIFRPSFEVEDNIYKKSSGHNKFEDPKTGSKKTITSNFAEHQNILHDSSTKEQSSCTPKSYDIEVDTSNSKVYAEEENKPADQHMDWLTQNEDEGALNKVAITVDQHTNSPSNPDNVMDDILEDTLLYEQTTKNFDYGDILQEAEANENKIKLAESGAEIFETYSGGNIGEQHESISIRSNIEWSAPEMNPLQEEDDSKGPNEGNVIIINEQKVSTPNPKIQKSDSSGIGPPKASGDGHKHSQRYPKKPLRKDLNESQDRPHPSTSRSYKESQHPENGSSEAQKNRRQNRNVPRNGPGNYQTNEKHTDSTSEKGSNGSKDYYSRNYSPTQWRSTQRRGKSDVEKLNTEVSNLKKALATQQQEMKEMMNLEFEKKLNIQEGVWQKVIALQQSQEENKNVYDQKPPRRRYFNRNKSEMVRLRNDLQQLEEDFFTLKDQIRRDLIEELKQSRIEQNSLIESRFERYEDEMNVLIDKKIRAFKLEYVNGSQYSRY